MESAMTGMHHRRVCASEHKVPPEMVGRTGDTHVHAILSCTTKGTATFASVHILDIQYEWLGAMSNLQSLDAHLIDICIVEVLHHKINRWTNSKSVLHIVEVVNQVRVSRHRDSLI